MSWVHLPWLRGCENVDFVEGQWFKRLNRRSFARRFFGSYAGHYDEGERDAARLLLVPRLATLRFAGSPPALERRLIGSPWLRTWHRNGSI